MLAFSAGHLHALGRPGWVMAFLFTVVRGAAARALQRLAGPLQGPLRGHAVAGRRGHGRRDAVVRVVPARERASQVDVPEVVVASGVVVLGLLMVSPIPYRSGKELDLRHSYGTLVLVVIALALIVQEPSVTLFAIGLAYVLSGPVEWLWRRATGAPLPGDRPGGRRCPVEPPRG